MTGRVSPACRYWIGSQGRRCGAWDDVHPYPAGWRCSAHTPAALAGRPEPPPGPGWPAGAWATPVPVSAGWSAIDARAIATGKRRSSITTYRAAQAALTRNDAAPRPG
ncbi:hypothetical protein AQ490_23320 [Wenjunlia vitaminophila]|uniref:Uncharacterized protein n=1 Tax=Wenjunlia vitaminophila TaxID=76728 RepID=A0A0T6LSK6_WENVI|nr:hypothetical protein [Wenjunlia vitaminophila]KRV48802.1 hypothetical protein AQ490_23320 [Wenjunlia vitaminophila]